MCIRDRICGTSVPDAVCLCAIFLCVIYAISSAAVCQLCDLPMCCTSPVLACTSCVVYALSGTDVGNGAARLLRIKRSEVFISLFPQATAQASFILARPLASTIESGQTAGPIAGLQCGSAVSSPFCRASILACHVSGQVSAVRNGCRFTALSCQLSNLRWPMSYFQCHISNVLFPMPNL
eukprot:1549977-Rhodomonas_salina.1